MPQVKINVNGEKFVLSGMSRSACRKELLYALAKMNSKVKETHSIVNHCSTEGFISKSAGSKVHESKYSIVSGEDVYKTLLILGKERSKQKERNKYGKLKTKRSSKNSRNTHKYKQKQTSNDVDSLPLADDHEIINHDELLRSKDSQKETFFHGNVLKPMSDSFEKTLKRTRKLERQLFKRENYEYLNDLVNAQKKCLKTQRRRIKEKENKIKHYCKRLEKGKAKDTEQLIWTSDSVNETNKEAGESLESYTKTADTDHDTGISEQHSSDVEGTYELNYVLKNKQTMVSTSCFEKENIFESKEREQRSQEIVEATASRQICRGINESLSCKLSEETFTTSVVNLENTHKTDPRHDVKAKKETEKIHEDIKLLQSQLEEQNRLINLLNDLVVKDECVIEKDNTQVQIVDEACLQRRLNNLRNSIALSIELYDYQKSEMETNAETLRHTEKEIRRKRWHVDSLRKHLASLTMCTHSSRKKERGPREEYHRVNGTLV